MLQKFNEFLLESQLNENSSVESISADDLAKEFGKALSKLRKALNKGGKLDKLSVEMGDFIDYDNGRDENKILAKYNVVWSPGRNGEGTGHNQLTDKLWKIIKGDVLKWITDHWKEYGDDETVVRMAFNYLMQDENYHQFGTVALKGSTYQKILDSKFKQKGLKDYEVEDAFIKKVKDYYNE